MHSTRSRKWECFPIVGGSLWVLRLLPPLNWLPWYSSNIAGSDVKHQQSIIIWPNINLVIIFFLIKKNISTNHCHDSHSRIYNSYLLVFTRGTESTSVFIPRHRKYIICVTRYNVDRLCLFYVPYNTLKNKQRSKVRCKI